MNFFQMFGMIWADASGNRNISKAYNYLYTLELARLGMQIALGRVRRKTSPARRGVLNSPCPHIFRLYYKKDGHHIRDAHSSFLWFWSSAYCQLLGSRGANDLGVLKYLSFTRPHLVGNLPSGSTAYTRSIDFWISSLSRATLQIATSSTRPM